MIRQTRNPPPSRTWCVWGLLACLAAPGCPVLLEDSFDATEGTSEFDPTGGHPSAGAAGEAGAGESNGTGGTIVLVSGGGQDGTGGYGIATGGQTSGGSLIFAGGAASETGGVAGSSGAGNDAGGETGGSSPTGGTGGTEATGGVPTGGTSGSTGGATGGSAGGSCDDEILNQDETDVDCGGVCGSTCADGAECLANADCSSNWCSGGAWIELVSATSFTGTMGSLTQPVTIGGEPNRMLVVACGLEGSTTGGNITSVSFDGTELGLASDHVLDETRVVRAAIYYQGEGELPAAGTYTLTVQLSLANEWICHVLELRNVADLPPEAAGGNDDGETGAETISTSITTSTDLAWALDVLVVGEAITMTPTGTGQVERGERTGSGMSVVTSTQQVSAAGSTTLGWSADGTSNRMAHAVAAFGPSAQAGSCETASCQDDVQNAAETDVDCGGDDCDACASDQSCADDNDCSSMYSCTEDLVCGSDIGI